MFVLMMSLIWVLCGCGGSASNNNITPVSSSGGSTSTTTSTSPTPTPSTSPSPGTSPSPSPGATAQVVINQTLSAQTTVPASVVNERFTGVDSTGKVVFGPQTVKKAAVITLTVPVTVVALGVEYLDANGTTLFVYSQPVTLTAGQTTTITNPAITPAPGPAAKLAFVVQPSTVAAGSPINPAVQVQVQDANGNPVTTSGATIALAIGTNPGSATIGGTTSVNALLGTAVFSNVTISASGNGFTLNAASTGLTSATSGAFNVTGNGPTPPAASALKFVTQPSNVSTGSVITPAVTVQIVDASQNVVTTATNVVTLAIGTNPGGATLGGTVSVAAVNGVATFNNLTLNKGGNGYTLTASATGLTGATSSAFKDIRVLSFATATQLASNASTNSQIYTTGRYHNANFDDFAVSQNGANNIMVYLSNGDGTFNNGTTFNTGNAPIALASADIDGDGKVDIVVQCQTEVDVMLNNGAGSFTKFAFATGNNNSSLAGITVGKFTKSSKIDVVTVDTVDNSIWLFQNTSAVGAPNLTKFNTVGPAGLGSAKGLATGDFNGDGAPDFCSGNFTSNGTVVVWLNANTGVANTTFQAGGASTLTMSQNNSVAQSVAAGDFNGDGKSDIFCPDDSPQNGGGIQNPGDAFIAKAGGFNAPVIYNLGDDPFSAGVADFNGDGILDVGVASTFGLPFSGTSPSDLEILLGIGDGTFVQPTKTFQTHAGDNSARGIGIGDFNGDGLPDAVIGSNPTWVFINTSK